MLRQRRYVDGRRTPIWLLGLVTARPQSSKVWYYDYRTNVHQTLKQKPLTFAHLEDFVACYKPDNRHVREQTWSKETPEVDCVFQGKVATCSNYFIRPRNQQTLE